jgi:hypothetical protein
LPIACAFILLVDAANAAAAADEDERKRDMSIAFATYRQFLVWLAGATTERELD